MKRNPILDKIRQSRENYIDVFVDNSFDLSCRIQFLMEEKGMDQKAFAERLEKKESEISKWLCGSHNFTLKTLAKIEDVLGNKLFDVCVNQTVSAKTEFTVNYQSLTFNCSLNGVDHPIMQKYPSKKFHKLDLEPIQN